MSASHHDPLASLSVQAAAHSRAEAAYFDSSRLADFSERVALDAPAALQTPLVREPGRLLVTCSRLYFQPLHDVAGDAPVRRYRGHQTLGLPCFDGYQKKTSIFLINFIDNFSDDAYTCEASVL